MRNDESLIPKISLALLALLGMMIFRDYGISPDEEQQRLIGQTSLKYIGNLFGIGWLINEILPLKNPGDIFLNFKDRDYGVAFEMPVELLIKILNIESSAEAYYFRHALTFLTYLGAVFATYKLTKERYASWRIGIIAAIFLVLSPRIFGESFFNNKDIVFMSAYIIGTYTLINFLKSPSLKTTFFHAIACGVAIDIRIMAIILPIATVAIIFMGWITNSYPIKKYSYLLLYFLCITAATILLLWPWLWLDPIANLIAAFKNMSQFRWGGEMFFMGKIIASNNLPWYYVPVWIAVSTPTIYLLFFCIGSLAILKTINREKFSILKDANNLQDVIILVLFIAPLIAINVFNSVLYNGWRHLYFIYPLLILIAMHGVVVIWDMCKDRLLNSVLFILFIFISITWTTIWMIKFHPYQYLYFNVMAGNWPKNFDVDYWGVAYRHPLENILRSNPGNKILIFNNMGGMTWGLWQIPYWQNIPLLDKDSKNRIDGTHSEKCSDFIIASVQGNATQYFQNKDFHLVDKVMVDGKLVYAIFKRNVSIIESQPKIGKSINFSENATQCFLKSGWSKNSEDWGVWSIDRNALIEIPTQDIYPTKLQLVIKPFVNSKIQNQSFQIGINNQKMHSFKLDQFRNQKITLDIPSTGEKVNILRINFVIPQAVSPKILGFSQDERLLGVGLVSLTLE